MTEVVRRAGGMISPVLKSVFVGAVVTGVGLGVGSWMVDGVRGWIKNRSRHDS